MERMKLRILLVVALWVTAVFSGAAQITGAGAIQGTVTDPTGAVVAGATVRVVRTDTNQAVETKTNSAGFYSVPSLFVADYSVTVAQPGMTEWQSSLKLQAGQTASLDVHLQLQTVSTQVQVIGDQTTLINKEDSTLSTNVERQQIEQIPQNGRFVAGILSSTVPGYQGGNGNQPRVNGLVWGAFSWTQDGASMDYRDGGGLDNVPPDPDTVQEIQVETSNSSALADRPAYAVLSTKSGTNRFHGSAFETNRDSSFGVAHNRQDSISAKPPKYIRNEYGISGGGPIFIPHLYDGRDKSFIFAAWSGMNLRQNQYTFYYVPTMAMRNGDFSQAFSSNGTLYKVYDPNTTATGTISGNTVTGFQRQQFSYNGVANVIAPSRISPLAKALYAITPAPTDPNSNPYSASTGNYQGPQPIAQDQREFTMRLDQHINDKNLAFFTYNKGHRLQYNFGASGGAPTTDGIWNGQFQPLDSQRGTLSWTHVSSSHFNQTILASMNYQSWRQQGSPSSVVNQNITSSLGIENIFGRFGLPQIQGTTTSSNGSQTSLMQGYDQGSNPWRDSDYTNIFADNLQWTHRSHNILFGGEYRHDRLNIQPDGSRPATVAFGNLGTANLNTSAGTAFSASPFTGLATADFFIGNAQSYTNALPPGYLHLREQETDLYLQDNYHILRNLTLNVGLRYQALPAPHERQNQFTSFDYASASIVTGEPISALIAEGKTTQTQINALQAIGVNFKTPDQVGLPAGVFQNYWWNFLPRVGVAWMPFGDAAGFVLRGGFGQYAYKTPLRNLYGGFNESVPYTSSYAQDYANALQTDGYSNYLIRAKQPVVAGQNSTGIINTNIQNSVCNGCFGYTTVASDLKPEGYTEWNFTAEKDLHRRTSVTVSYMGNHGYNLEQYWQTNSQLTPYIWYSTTGTALPTGTYSRTAIRIYNKTTYGDIQQIRKTGISNANMVQIRLQKTFDRGFSYNVSYVMGKYFRAGGNSSRDSVTYMPAAFMPGTISSDPIEAARTQTYLQDTAMPRQQIKYDWVWELPFGRKRHFLSQSNRLIDSLIGGWQISGTGDMSQTLWQPSSSDWGTFNKLHTYGRSVPIQDCTSGSRCRQAYLAYNGYIPANQINPSTCTTGQTVCGYQGIPANYVPEHQPLNLSQNNQALNVTLANGQVVTNVPYTLGPTNALNPNFHTYLPNPFVFNTNASLFKAFPITEKVSLRLNGDFFNVFNQQGTTGVNGGNGIITTTSSRNTARIVQLSGRISW